MSFQLVLNGLGSGSSLQRLLAANMDPDVLRPWVELDQYGRPTGRNCITINVKNPDGSVKYRTDEKTGALLLNSLGKPVPCRQNLLTNAPATLRQEDWLRIDERVRFAAKQRLRLWGDVYGTNPVNIPNGMGTIALQHAVATGDASATISMDPIRKGERSRPTLDTALIPLPVIHSDGSFSAREIAVSRNGGLPLDTTNIELSSRKVAETVEQLTLGTASSYTYAGGTIYGLINHPTRFTKVLTAPTGSNGGTTLAELLDMIQTLQNNFYYGPYIAYYSNSWEQYLARDYTTTYPGSLRRRIQEGIPQIAAWRNLDYLTGYQIILVQMTPDVIEGIQGMPITTVQWEEQGGFEQCFKVLCIQVPRVRADGNGKLGVMHGAVP
jgi:hypothetical protein